MLKVTTEKQNNNNNNNNNIASYKQVFQKQKNYLLFLHIKKFIQLEKLDCHLE
jgi:hypothetical protein